MLLATTTPPTHATGSALRSPAGAATAGSTPGPHRTTMAREVDGLGWRWHVREPRVGVVSASVTLPVSDWHAALAWYVDVLGCEVSGVDVTIGEVVELRFGQQRFSLWLDWGDPRIPRVDDTEARAPSLVLRVRSLVVARKALAARGATLSRTPTRLWRVEDPFGNHLLLVQAPRRRQSAKLRASLVQYVLDSEQYRSALAETMRAAGVESFETAAAHRAFARQHGLRAPRPPPR